MDGGIVPVEGGRVTAPDSNMRSGDGSDMMSERQLSDTSLSVCCVCVCVCVCVC